MKNMFNQWRADLPSGLVVFLVALPLCLGVALASTGDPKYLFSGIISGVIGGIVIGFLSGSRIGVSGPAAGLIMIVSAAITTLGSYEAFLVAVLISGIIQLIAGFLRAGVIGNYFPSSVIKGMLAAIGITLILKEIPHAVGYDVDFMGDEAFIQRDGHNTLTTIFDSLNYLSTGAIIVSIVSLLILILFERFKLAKFALFKFIPGALIVVVVGILLNQLFMWFAPDLMIQGKHLVQLPVLKSAEEIPSLFFTPDFSILKNPQVYVVALTIAIVASLETLLSLEATDKLDFAHAKSSANRELKAQGVGNILAGLIGGLPVTQVIVRSTANINAGAATKMSAVYHGIILFGCVLLIPFVLNMIPLAALAAILIMIGYKLAKVSLFKAMYKLGWAQFIPFIGTIVGVLFTDLLRGIGIGMVLAIFYILRNNIRNNFKLTLRANGEGKVHTIQLSEEVTFLNKGGILDALNSLPHDACVVIDGSNCHSIDYDVLELISEFERGDAKEKNIDVKKINIEKVELSFNH